MWTGREALQIGLRSWPAQTIAQSANDCTGKPGGMLYTVVAIVLIALSKPEGMLYALLCVEVLEAGQDLVEDVGVGVEAAGWGAEAEE